MYRYTVRLENYTRSKCNLKLHKLYQSSFLVELLAFWTLTWTRSYTSHAQFHFLSIFFTKGKFLQSLVSMSNAKTVLEIGTFTGYAALAMAEVLPDDGTVTTCEIDPFLEPLASEMFAKSPHGRKITIRLG